MAVGELRRFYTRTPDSDPASPLVSPRDICGRTIMLTMRYDM